MVIAPETTLEPEVTAAASDIGSGTTAGEEDAGTTVPPSKCHVWARL